MVLVLAIPARASQIFSQFAFGPSARRARCEYSNAEFVMEKAIRVLVANRPRMMRELIVATFADQPDIEIVGEVATDEEIPNTVERTMPDLVVVALDEPGRRPRVCDVVLRQHPEIRIIGVDTKQNYSVFYWASLDIHSSAIEASEEGLLNAARSGKDLVQ
jgi:chemotaxis response regulator CheB